MALANNNAKHITGPEVRYDWIPRVEKTGWQPSSHAASVGGGAMTKPAKGGRTSEDSSGGAPTLGTKS